MKNPGPANTLKHTLKVIELKEKLKSLPKKPGVYIFKNQAGKIIYIGKALSLKNRVSSYFKQKHTEPKTIELVSQIKGLQIFEVASEFEALLLEAKLIKQHKPKYNIQAKDGKSYLYILISKAFPSRIYASRQPENEEDLLAWFGPFPSSREVQEILKTIRRIFPFRSCTNLSKRVCLYHHLKLCPGVCVYPDENYPKTVEQIKQLLSGKTKTLLKSLEKEMKSASKALDFEIAKKLKYKIESLQRLTQGWKNIAKDSQYLAKGIEEIKHILIDYGRINLLAISKIEGYDVSNLGNQIIVGSMVAFINGLPDKSLYRKFNLKYNLDSQDDPEGIRQIVRRRLNHPEWILPQVLLIDGGKTQINAAFQSLKEKNLENQIALLGLTKEEEILLIPQIKNKSINTYKRLRLPRNSEALQILQHLRDESHRFAQKYYRQLHLKKSLLLG